MLSLIAAVATNGCIGKNGKLPWNIPEDMEHFRALTKGKTVLMGRKTWESLPAQFRPLPDRKNIVITRQQHYTVPPEVLVYPTIAAALTAHADESVMVIGGAEIYQQTMNDANTLVITHVHQDVDGDAFFPAIDPLQWKETDRDDHPNLSFVMYTRKQ